MYTILLNKWYYVSMYWIAESSGFHANPEIRIRIKILLTGFPDAVLLRRINDAPIHPLSSSPDTLRRSLTRKTAHRYSTIDTLIPPSVCPLFPVELAFFIHAIPVTCCKVYSFCAVNILKVLSFRRNTEYRKEVPSISTLTCLRKW